MHEAFEYGFEKKAISGNKLVGALGSRLAKTSPEIAKLVGKGKTLYPLLDNRLLADTASALGAPDKVKNMVQNMDLSKEIAVGSKEHAMVRDMLGKARKAENIVNVKKRAHTAYETISKKYPQAAVLPGLLGVENPHSLIDTTFDNLKKKTIDFAKSKQKKPTDYSWAPYAAGGLGAAGLLGGVGYLAGKAGNSDNRDFQKSAEMFNMTQLPFAKTIAHAGGYLKGLRQRTVQGMEAAANKSKMEYDLARHQGMSQGYIGDSAVRSRKVRGAVITKDDAGNYMEIPESQTEANQGFLSRILPSKKTVGTAVLGAGAGAGGLYAYDQYKTPDQAQQDEYAGYYY
jgi:hypothetical protein